MTRNCIIIAAIIGLTSCHSNTSSEQSPIKKDSPMADHSAMSAHDSMASKPNLKILAFDYKKDPACGMPLTAGLEDTTTYKGKLYGFCSKECKEAFLKDPKSYTASIKK